ncbi:MAG: glycosyltransferase [Proteobacteria bacterium]|nr:glycosyltransferase [Pseudomonadota bacterium]
MPDVMLSNALRHRHRVLLIRQGYYVVPELERALAALGVPLACLSYAHNAGFLKQLYQSVASFRPTILLTVNHIGLDGQGEVLDFLRQGRVAVASWLVDNHEFYIPQEVSTEARLMVFTWNPEAVARLLSGLVPHAQYLPLAGDPAVFTPGHGAPAEQPVGFAGAMWAAQMVTTMRAGRFPAEFLRAYRTLAAELERDPGLEVDECLRRHAPELWTAYCAASRQNRLLQAELLLREATRLHRLRCIRELMPLTPVIMGEKLWRRVLARHGLPFLWQPEVPYGAGLADFYRGVAVNVNATSLKSREALNQRVFDVPLCGGFLLTDHPRSLEACFEIGTEAACYEGADSLAEETRRWLGDPAGRRRISQAARKRILAEHTYQHRVAKIIGVMDAAF